MSTVSGGLDVQARPPSTEGGVFLLILGRGFGSSLMMMVHRRLMCFMTFFFVVVGRANVYGFLRFSERHCMRRKRYQPKSVLTSMMSSHPLWCGVVYNMILRA